MLLVDRNDGFGQRIKALLQGIRLSGLTGQPYKFLWNEKGGIYGSFHSCPPVHEVFNDDYISLHFSKSLASNVALRLNSQADINEINEHDIYSVDGRSRFLDGLNETYIEEFDKIGFSEKVSSAIAAAYSITLPKIITAIHLRGGDICFGPLKRKSIIFQSKVVPISLAKAIISELDGEALIFSQDEEFKDYFTNFENVIFSSDLMVNSLSSSLEKTIFDIVLMSRCGRIVGGDSAVPLVASMMSGVEIRSPLTYFTSKDIIESIEKDSSFENNLYDLNTQYFITMNLIFHCLMNGIYEEKMSYLVNKVYLADELSAQSLLFIYLYEPGLVIESPFLLQQGKSLVDDCIDFVSEFERNSKFRNFLSEKKFDIKNYKVWLENINDI